MKRISNKKSSFKTVGRIVQKEVGELTVSKVTVSDKKEGVTVSSTFGIFKYTDKATFMGGFTSYRSEREDVELGFDTLEEAITRAEELNKITD